MLVEVRVGIMKLMVSPQEAVRLVMFSKGFDDVDIEPMGDHVRLRATGNGMSYTAKGSSVSDVCEKTIERMANGWNS